MSDTEQKIETEKIPWWEILLIVLFCGLAAIGLVTVTSSASTGIAGISAHLNETNNLKEEIQGCVRSPLEEWQSFQVESEGILVPTSTPQSDSDSYQSFARCIENL